MGISGASSKNESTNISILNKWSKDIYGYSSQNNEQSANDPFSKNLDHGNIFLMVSFYFLNEINQQKTGLSTAIQQEKDNKNLQNQIQALSNDINAMKNSDGKDTDISSKIEQLKKLAEEHPEFLMPDGKISLLDFVNSLHDGKKVTPEKLQTLTSGLNAIADNLGGDTQIQMTELQQSMKNLSNDYQFYSGALNQLSDTLKNIFGSFR